MTTSDDGGSEARPSSAPSFPDHVTDLSLRRRRWMLLGVAAIIAGAGVAYELALMLLGTVTVGSTERANAVVLGAAMFGMGVGATTGGRLANRPVVAFVGVESLLAVLGAAAAPFLYWSWATLDAFWGPLLAVAFVLGLCIGAEMPLLAALNDRLAKQHASTVVAAFTAADYFGALVGAVGVRVRGSTVDRLGPRNDPGRGGERGHGRSGGRHRAHPSSLARGGDHRHGVDRSDRGRASSADRVTDNGRQRLQYDRGSPGERLPGDHRHQTCPSRWNGGHEAVPRR